MDESVNVLAPEFRADPYPFYAGLRRRGPVCRVEPGGMWAVTRHEEVLFVLRHPELFSSQGFRTAWQPPWVGYNPLANSMIAMDPPAHARLRGLVTRGFGPRSIGRLEPRVRALAGDLAAGIEGEVEFIHALAMPLPAFVIGELLGLDHELCAHFKRWADDILSVTPEHPGPEAAARILTGGAFPPPAQAAAIAFGRIDEIKGRICAARTDMPIAIARKLSLALGQALEDGEELESAAWLMVKSALTDLVAMHRNASDAAAETVRTLALADA